MKIALIDNMNNNYFSLARYFRDLGYDAHVFYNNSLVAHFHPQADSFENVDDLDYVHKLPFDLTPKHYLQFLLQKNKLRKLLNSYDKIIACGYSLAFLHKLGIKVDIAAPYGSDLYYSPWPELQSFGLKGLARFACESLLAGAQIQAFKNSNRVTIDTGYELYRDACEKLGVVGIPCGLPMVYKEQSSRLPEVWKFLEQHDFIVMSHSRHCWFSGEPGLADFEQYGGIKGNHRLIEGFAKFLESSKFKKPVLVLFEYGQDLQESKKLVSKIGIEEFVKWMPLMQRKEIMQGVQYANFSANAFRENLIDIGGVAYESLVCGTPLLNNCEEAINDPSNKYYNCPMIHALTADDICRILIDYQNDPDKYIELGKKSQEWFDRNLGLGLAKEYIRMLENPEVSKASIE